MLLSLLSLLAGHGNDGLDSPRARIRVKEMATVKGRAKPAARATAAQRQLGGPELARLLRRMDSAKSAQEKKRWRKEFMRGFYGDKRADSYV